MLGFSRYQIPAVQGHLVPTDKALLQVDWLARQHTVVINLAFLDHLYDLAIIVQSFN